jgi:hypothetical protein
MDHVKCFKYDLCLAYYGWQWAMFAFVPSSLCYVLERNNYNSVLETGMKHFQTPVSCFVYTDNNF